MKRWAVVSALALLWGGACKTVEEGSLRGEDLPEEERDDRPKDLSDVPSSLWSPGERKASSGYYYLVGEMKAMRNGSPKESLALFETAYSLDPGPFLGAKMVEAKAAAGQHQKALKEAKKMVLLYPKHVRLRYLYGELLASQGRLEEAVEHLNTCRSLDPSFEGCYVELATIHESGDRRDEAIAVLESLTEEVSSSLVGWSQLARLYLSGGDHEKALKPARRAYQMKEDNPRLAQVYAVVLHLNGKTEKALRVYEKLYRMNPTNHKLTSRMVNLYRDVGDLDEALSLLEQMAKAADDSARAGVEMQRAILLWEMKRFKKAAELLGRLTREYPESARLRYMAGLGQERLGQMEKALKTYASVPEASPFRYHADFRRVVVLKETGRLEDAGRVARENIERDQAEWDLFGLLGGIYSEMERYDEAIEVVSRGYEEHSDHPRLLFLKGVYQEKAGDEDACIATMRKVIEVDPDNSSAYNYLGYLYAERGENLDEAERLVRKALELKPDDGFYMDSLGWVHYQQGNYEKAEPLLKKAAKVQPEEGVILEHLGDLKKAQEDPEQAKSYYEQALDAELNEESRARVKEKLSELSAEND